MENKNSVPGEYKNHIVQYSADYSLCAGCSSCEIICGLMHEGAVSPSFNRIFLERGGTRDMVCHIASCQHCVDHPCYEACPKKDEAMYINEDGIVLINEEHCIGCGKCIKACKFDPPRINMAKNSDRKKWKAKKCDMCYEREEGPACVQYCPVRCIGISKEAIGFVTDPIVEEKIEE